MTVAIVVLSDIHFDSADKNPILSRADRITSAVQSENIGIDGLVVILAGDIANNGLKADYEFAHRFVAQLKDGFNKRYPGLHMHLLVIPGNHDCDLPKDGLDHRRNQVETSVSTFLTSKPDRFFLKDLMRVQNDFWEFAAISEYAPVDDYGKLCGIVSLQFGDLTLQFTLCNSAALSQRTEDRGGIFLPTSLLQDRVPPPPIDTVSIAVVHHPLQWLEPDNLLTFRHFLSRTCDMVLTGHQHVSAGFWQEHDTGERLRFFEGPPLYDRKEKLPSAFRTITIDTVARKQKECSFEWKDDLYRPTSSTHEWRPLDVNRGIRQIFEPTSEFRARLSDPGVVYIHPERPRIAHSDLFVYPDLRPTATKRPAKPLRGSEVLERLLESGVHLIRGDAFSGKTALTKALFTDSLIKRNLVPVLLDLNGRFIRDGTHLESLVIGAFREQYRQADVDAYRQLLPSQRVIIIDDWHLARITPTERIAAYNWLRPFAQSSILFTDRLYELKQIVSGNSLLNSDIDPEEELVKKFEIVGLSHVGRGELINRWMSLRKEAAFDPPHLSKESKATEDEISRLLGQDRLPPYAFFIVCLLQAKESRTINTIVGGSFGHLYEVLVTSALNKASGGDSALDRQHAFLAEIAAALWKRKQQSISRKDIDSVAEQYASQFSIELKTDSLLREFVSARILARSPEDRYSFQYSHFFYYFVARYIRDRIDDDEDSYLQTAIDDMIDNISSQMHSTIIMFLIYFAKEKKRIIERLVTNASRIYTEVQPADLGDEVPPYSLAGSGHEDEPDIPMVGENDDIAVLRMEERKRLDQLEPQVLMTTDDPYQYSIDLPDVKKIHLADRNLDALGQVIRNFSATLPVKTKVEVLKCAYLLGLRMMRRLMDLLEIVMGVTAVLFEAHKKQQEGSLSKTEIQEIDQLLRRLRLRTRTLVALYCLKKLSGSVGVADMERAYEAVMSTMPDTNAMKLLDVTIQMDHFGSFPLDEILSLDKEFVGQTFPREVLHWMVATYAIMFRIERTTRQRIAGMLKKGSLPLDEAKLLLLSVKQGAR